LAPEPSGRLLNGNFRIGGQPPRARNLIDFRERRFRLDHRQMELPLSIWGHPVGGTIRASACQKGDLVDA
jgi:hypothetical protein